MNPADLTIAATSPSFASKTLPAPLSAGTALKNGKVSLPRVDLEPIYTQLKAALGDEWTEYKMAVTAFVVGNLNQAELSWVLQPLLSPAPSVFTSGDPARSPLSTLNLHNTLLAALYANVLRDFPPTDVAPWVVATDKPTTASKSAGATGANDKAEERLKRETMALHARDRKRIKSLKETPVPVNDGFKDMVDYKHELAVKAPDVAPQSGGGLAKTNWDLEIRRRYAQPLAADNLEFPALSDIQNRIEPICYEEGLAAPTQGNVPACAELVEQATEVYLKSIITRFVALSRSDAEGSIQTATFKRQLRKEGDEVDRGILQRNPAGLLPVEMEARAKRDTIQLDDMRVALELKDSFFRRDPFLSERIWLSRYADPTPQKVNGISPYRPLANGVAARLDVDDPMAIDGEEYWKGGAKADCDELMGVLDDCLAVGG